MSKKREPIEYHEHDTPGEEEFPDISGVASANECTGLMYKTPMSAEEWESYQELSSMEIPKGEDGQTDPLPQKLKHAKTAEETGEAVEEAAGEYSPKHMKE